jgi:hypothetical protein
MPYNLPLPDALRRVWRVKIYDFERLEEPHVTIRRKRRTWRLSLRGGRFLDPGDRWSQIDGDIRREIEASWAILQAEWDRIHPDNPILRDPDEAADAPEDEETGE